MKRAATTRLFASVLTGLILASRASAAGLLTFETTPGGATPVDDTPLTTPYPINGGTVRFFFDDNANNVYDQGIDTNPHFERSGGDVNESIVGFRGAGGPDAVRPGVPGLAEQLGDWFLRKAGNVDSATPSPFIFIADYDTTASIRELSGEIWDIDGNNDGTEQWRVDVLSASGGILATQFSPLGVSGSPASLDQLPWQFAFVGLPDSADKVRLTFIGSKTEGVGLAFNNFSPDVAVPEPSLLMLPLAAVALLLRRRP